MTAFRIEIQGSTKGDITWHFNTMHDTENDAAGDSELCNIINNHLDKFIGTLKNISSSK